MLRSFDHHQGVVCSLQGTDNRNKLQFFVYFPFVERHTVVTRRDAKLWIIIYKKKKKKKKKKKNHYSYILAVNAVFNTKHQLVNAVYVPLRDIITVLLKCSF